MSEPSLHANGHVARVDAFPPKYLRTLARGILACPYFVANTLNRDFVATRGFSVVFRRPGIPRVASAFPFLAPYMERVLTAADAADCNAFYLNPLGLERGSRVDPHVDRSLRSYAPRVDPPRCVSVLYVAVPSPLVGGELVLSRGRRMLGRVTPRVNTLLTFAGDLTHAVSAVSSEGLRLSVVCEQYALGDDELASIPEFLVESRALSRM